MRDIICCGTRVVEGPFSGAGRSELDMDRINMFKYADITHVPWTWSTLRAGDCIFIPAGRLTPSPRTHIE